MDENMKLKCEEFRQHLSAVFGLHCGFVEVEELGEEDSSSERAVIAEFLAASKEEHFCRYCKVSGCNRKTEYQYGIREAHRWDGKYTFYCPLGLAFIASSIEDTQGNLLGGFAVGPMVMGDQEDIEDILVNVARQSSCGSAMNVFITTPMHVLHMCEILAGITSSIMGSERRKGVSQYKQKEILDAIFDAKEKYTADQKDYYDFLEFEKQLQEAVYSRNRKQLEVLYGSLLGRIGYLSAVDLDATKARTIEILVILSRAAIGAGADVQTIFHISKDFNNQLEKMDSPEQLALWLTDTLERFASAIFDFAGAKHHDVVGQTMAYVKENYDKKITLDELAGRVYLSRSYLCSIFKESVGTSIVSYINRIRIQKSRQLLSDRSLSLSQVAIQCGFVDQSYFTKMFKREMGVSPKQYRDNMHAFKE